MEDISNFFRRVKYKVECKIVEIFNFRKNIIIDKDFSMPNQNFQCFNFIGNYPNPEFEVQIFQKESINPFLPTKQNYINNNNNRNNNLTNNNYINHNNFINNYNNNYNNNSNNNNYNNINNNFKNNISNNAEEKRTYNQSNHLRGLVNIASTCYMNSTIQCFAHIKELFVYFQKEKIIKLMDIPNSNQKLFHVFARLINCLWHPYDTTPVYPYMFKEKLGLLNPLFQGALPNDAKDLLTFILMQLHDELNNPINNNNNNQSQNIIANINIQTDKKAMLKQFLPYFKNNYRSIISELFYGLTYNETQCLFCKTKLYNYQTFNFLIFPLSQVLNYKMQQVNFQNNFNNTVTLEDCFKYNQTITPLNDYYCNSCKQTTKGAYSNFISVLPNIIIIILNRGVGLQYKVKIDFDENLVLGNYVEFFNNDAFYGLIGLVTHYGESGASGHFMARCKSPIDGNWYLYNDAIVQKIGFFKKEEFLQGNPYILFYKKITYDEKK
jgi:ubiquitin C-terminal hydrolase